MRLFSLGDVVRTSDPAGMIKVVILTVKQRWRTSEAVGRWEAISRSKSAGKEVSDEGAK